MTEIYLDHAATTPLDPAVVEAITGAMSSLPGNASSVHRAGQRARAAIERAREEVALAVGARPREVVFTSGATEADNHALRAAAAVRPGQRIITSRAEHSAVLATAERLAAEGTPVTFLDPEPDGSVSVDRVTAALADDVALVALMYVNNETGAITDVPEIARRARAAGAWVFTDAVQALGTLPVDMDALGVDMLAISAHKAHGPKGVGALVVRGEVPLVPLLAGGAQERGFRPGTENTAAIVGFGVAASLVRERWAEDGERIRGLRDRLESALRGVPGAHVVGAADRRGPKHLNVRFEGVEGETLLMALDSVGVAASAGSACAAGSIEPSHVLLAAGLSRQEAKSSIRFTLGRGLDRAMVDEAAARIEAAVTHARRVAV